MSDQSADSLAPIVMELTVPRSVEDAFRLFTEEMATWWPLDTYSLEHGRAALHFDGRSGGEIYEQLEDGRRHVWGTIVVWQPHTRVAFTWHPGRDPEGAQEVEVRFTPSGPDTRVALEHRGWERAGIEGPVLRAGYAHGWVYVFGSCFGRAAGAATEQEAS